MRSFLCYVFRWTSPRPGSLWEATHVLLNKQYNSWSISRCVCSHRRAQLDSALKGWRRPSMLCPHCSSSSRPMWSSSRARSPFTLTCPPGRWSSSRRLFLATSWWGCPLSKQRATYNRSASAGNRLEDEDVVNHQIVIKVVVYKTVYVCMWDEKTKMDLCLLLCFVSKLQSSNHTHPVCNVLMFYLKKSLTVI